KIRKELGLRCIQKKKFKAAADSKHNLPVVENLLKQQFKADAPDKVWVSDITYIPTVEGRLCLAAHKDIYSGGIAGYAMGGRMTKQLVIDSLIKSIKTKKPKAGLINHLAEGVSIALQHIRI
ncbi:MAG: IS3 family transposase, partial [Desulfamplus sp.]|nr:IS3 family transposase [Desulfamplus sp.]